MRLMIARWNEADDRSLLPNEEEFMNVSVVYLAVGADIQSSTMDIPILGHVSYDVRGSRVCPTDWEARSIS